MKKTTVKLYESIAQLPDNKLTQPIKDKVGEKLTEELASVKQDLIKKKWDLVNLYQVLKQMSEDPDIPESKREEIKKSVQEFAEKNRVLQDKINEKLYKTEEDK